MFTLSSQALRRCHVPPLCALALTLAGAPACEQAPAGAPVTYHNEVKAILDAKCAGCHRAGGIGPIPLTTFQEVTSTGAVVRASIESGAMPPWKADAACNQYKNDFSLTDDERRILDAWFDAGMPEGEPSTSERGDPRLANPLAPGIRVDDEFPLADAPYVPDSADDYRCFAIAWPHNTPKFITGFNLVPGDASNVHHVNIFLNPPPAQVGGTDFVALDAEDPAPGYSCGRGARVLASALVGAWAPGASGVKYPEGTGQLVEPGASITLEVHYAAATGTPDASTLTLELEDTVARRGMGAAFWWFNNWDDGGMLIPAGESSVTHEVTLDPSLVLAVVAPWMEARLLEVHVAALHMHQFGSSGEINIRSPVGDTCLLNIPSWDFHWQMGYLLDEPATLFLGEDELHLRCTWNNSAANQPVVDGEPRQPVDLNWGPRTLDEMCIGFLYIVPSG